MRLLLFILLLCNIAYSQQLVTLCNGQSQTYFYSSDADYPGITEWQVNGLYYYGNSVALTWSDTGTFIISAMHYALDCPSEPVTYTVTVKQCDELIYYVPNAFTPDGDERNQTWGPVFTAGFDPYRFHLFIVNRWGEIVWESYDHTAKWNGVYAGKLCVDGVYTWSIDFGDKWNDARYTATGHVTIIR
jgi:gliding motility-associated-like protein